MQKKPNIIIFNPDEFRADSMGHLGNPAASTPTFDKLCREDAVSFSNAFCQNPVCTPSRCSYMSGLYPHVNGHRSMRYMLHEEEPVLLRELKENGYHVWWGGKNDLVPGDTEMEPYCDVKYEPKASCKKLFNLLEEKRGKAGDDSYYSYYIGEIDKGEEEFFYDRDWDYIFNAIKQIKERPKDKPLCIYLPLLYPHVPYAVEEPWFNIIDRKKLAPRTSFKDCSNKSSMLQNLSGLQGMKNWTEERWDELRATYLGMCSRLDHQFGLLLEALKEEKIYEDTAIFVISDHGDYCGDYDLVAKTDNNFEDCLTNVPFIIKPPSWVDVRPGVNDSMIELMDFYATVQELAGITPQHTHFSKSLVNIISGKETEHRSAVFSEGGKLKNENHLKALFGSLNKASYSWPIQYLKDGEGPEGGKAVMIRTKDYKYIKRLYECDELYDLRKDSKEKVNCINEIQYSDILQDLKEQLMDFYIGTSDIVPFKPDKR